MSFYFSFVNLVVLAFLVLSSFQKEGGMVEKSESVQRIVPGERFLGFFVIFPCFGGRVGWWKRVKVCGELSLERDL